MEERVISTAALSVASLAAIIAGSFLGLLIGIGIGGILGLEDHFIIAGEAMLPHWYAEWGREASFGLSAAVVVASGCVAVYRDRKYPIAIGMAIAAVPTVVLVCLGAASN
jgi:hypothetical protein